VKLKISGVDKVVSNLDIFVRKNGQMVSRAMNEVHTPSYTKASKATRDNFNIKASDLRRKDSVKRANSKNLKLIFSLKTHSIPLLEFTGRNNGVRKSGISYKVDKKKKFKVFKGAFINTSIKRHSDYVLVRRDDKRYPIVPLTVMTPSTMFIKSGADKVYIETFKDNFEKRYLHSISYITEKTLKK